MQCSISILNNPMYLHQKSQAKTAIAPAHRSPNHANQTGSAPGWAVPASPAPVSLEAIFPNPKLKLLDQVREVMRLAAQVLYHFTDPKIGVSRWESTLLFSSF